MMKICVVWNMQCTFTFLTQDYNKDDGMTIRLFNIMERLWENVYCVLIPLSYCSSSNFFQALQINYDAHIVYGEEINV